MAPQNAVECSIVEKRQPIRLQGLKDLQATPETGMEQWQPCLHQFPMFRICLSCSPRFVDDIPDYSINKKWGTIPQKYTKIGVYHACLFLVKLGWVLWYFTLLPWKEIYRLDWECGTPQSQPTVYQYIFQLKLAAIVWDMGMFIIDTPIYWSSKNISSIYMYLHNNNP